MKSVLRFLLFVLVVYSMITGAIGLFKTGEFDEDICVDSYEKVNIHNDRLHERSWDLMNYSKSFCASYQSTELLSLKAGKSRNEIIYERASYADIWGSVYSSLIKDSKSYIDFMVDSLIDISIEQKLTRSELAEMIVTFVQDIPYSYVRSEDCEKSENNGKPCIGNIALGLLSPYEFLHSLYGDCDTRAVLIYTILEELAFDPMIVVSNEYAHAMLALNIPAAGDHLKYRGKNYYFWETTAKGWPVGILPPTTNNVNYWKIALVNEH
ncbi:hypothetical protein [Ekhidna sp.]